MAEVITRQELEEANLDADSIAKFVNGGETEMVVTRTGASYPTAANIVKNVASNVIGALSISQGVYGTVAAGIAATTNGTFFSVVSADNLEYVILYLNVAGVAQERKRYPSYQAIQQIFEVIGDFGSDGGNTAFAFQDGMGFVMLKFLVDGAIDMLNGKIERTDYNGLELSDEYGMLYSYFGIQNSMINGLPIALDQQFSGFEFQDESGFIIAKCTEKGTYFGKQTPVTDVTAAVVSDLNGQQRTDIIQLISYGQSLSRGALARPPISLVQPYFNIMLKGGVLARPKDAAYDPTAFLPLVEAEFLNEGETPISGMCNGFVRRMVTEEGELPENWVMAGMAPGQGGRPVAQLSPFPLGTEGTYEGMIQAVRDCYALAKAQGKTYSVWATIWAQGENDNSSSTGTSRYKYSEQLSALIDAMARDIVAVTGQKNRPYFFTYQMNANRRYDRSDMRIAIAQWNLSKIRPDVSMFGPNYIFQRASDNNHLSAEGSWLMGEYAARAMKFTMANKDRKWRPLEPISVDWQDTHIDIKYHVPQGQIVIDTALVNQAPNNGFDLWVARTTPLSLITSVIATAYDTVRITLSAPAPLDAFLSYGLGRTGDVSGPLSGAVGNVRDTHGDFDKVTSPGNITYSMHNACVQFEYNRKTGF